MLLKHPLFRVFGVFRGKKIPSLIALLLLLGICFLSEVVESIMRGGDRGLHMNRFISYRI